MTDPKPRERHFVQSLERGLSVIRALSGAEPQSVTEVAARAQLTRAATRRFLLTLEDLGYVRADAGRYSLTPRTLDLGYAYLSSLSLPEIAQPHLQALVDQVHESSSVSVLDGSDVVYVARVAAGRIMSVRIDVGTRFPAHATSMGRVMIAGLSRDQQQEILAGADLDRKLTGTTVTGWAALQDELERVSQQGYALVDQELEEGLRSIAVPIHDAAGEVVAAINLSTHASRTPLETIKSSLLPPLKETAARIERDLG